MLKNSPMRNLKLHRKQNNQLQCKPIDCFLPELSLQRKGLLKKIQNSLQNTQVSFKGMHFT